MIFNPDKHDGNYPGNWDYIRKNVLRRDNYTCQECGSRDRQLHVHHIKPISEVGNHSLGNLKTLCYKCHKGKHPIKTYLYRAIKLNKTIIMTYRDKHGNRFERIVDPYKIHFSDNYNAEFLFAYDHHHNEIRTFRPKRVKYVNITESSYGRPKYFDPERMLDDYFGRGSYYREPPSSYDYYEHDYESEPFYRDVDFGSNVIKILVSIFYFSIFLFSMFERMPFSICNGGSACWIFILTLPVYYLFMKRFDIVI